MIKYFVMSTAETHCNTASSSRTTSEGKEAEQLGELLLLRENNAKRKKCSADL